ncbi:MAG: Calx-beta domain-containing protein [Actinomycetota bacterium]
MKLRPQAWITLVLFIAAAVGQTAASAGTFPGVNGKIAFAGDGEIEVINPDGTDRVELTDTPVGGENQPAWNAGGTKLVLTDSGHSFSTMNADGTNRTALFSHDTFAGNPTWSADGSVVAFDGFIGSMEGSRIFVVPAAGGTATELAAVDAQDPTYSPDGPKIAFEYDEGIHAIGVMNADGSGATNITPGGGANDGDYDPSWSPDGAKIAFKRAFQIWTMNADGSGTIQLTTGTDASYPTWSPDGTKIAFQRDDDIWVMDSDGSDAINITNTPDVDEKEPDWGVGTPPPPPAEGVEFSADTFVGSENDGNARTPRGAVITVVRTGSTAGAATVRFVTTDGSAKSSSVRKCRFCNVSPPDYLTASGILVFGDGEITKTFQVPIIDDGVIEYDETVNLTLKTVKLKGGASAKLGPRSTAVLTISDNDPNVSFERAASSGPEEDGAARLKVLLSSPVNRATVDYSVTGGTATAGEDYTLAAGTLRFGARFGARSPAIPLTVLDDNLKEQAETVRVELSAPTNAELGPITVHTFTIKENDPQGDVAGDTPTAALPVDLVVQPRQVIGESLSPANSDVDVYRVHLEAGDDLAIDVDPGGLSRLLSSTLTILGPDGTTELAVVGASEEPNGTGLTENPAHLFTASTEGDHYVRLSTDRRGGGGYTIELHRLALAEGFQAPAVLDEAGPMFAWLRGDTLGITGPTGYGFALQGPWTASTNFNKRSRTWSAVYTLAAGAEVDIRTAFGDLRMEALGDIVVATEPSRWGNVFGAVGPDPIPLRLGIPLDALVGDLRDRYGLDMTVSALENWTIMSGNQIMEGGRSPDGRSLPSGVEQLMPGIPYLLFNDEPAIAASFGQIRIEQEALDQKLLVILDPTDPFLYIRGEDIGDIKEPTLAFSRRGYIPFHPDLEPTIPDAVGLTDFSSHVFASGGIPAPHPAVAKYITIFADGSIDLDADDDGTWLAGEGNAHELASGDLSAFGEVLRDINLGANGRVIFHYNSDQFDFETPLGRATAVYNGQEEALWFRGRALIEESPLAGTPLRFLEMTREDFIEGTIRSDGQFTVTGGARYDVGGGELLIQLTLDNEGIDALVSGRVELKGSYKSDLGSISCTATAGAEGLLSFSYTDRLHMSGSLKLDGSVKCGKLSAKIDVSGTIDDGKIVVKLPYIGNKSISLF